MSSLIHVHLAVAIIAASVLTGCNCPSTARNERDAALAASVEAFATKLAAGDEFSGVVLLTSHGQPLVRRGYGPADRKAGRPNKPETPFMLSSVSKMFTAVTIVKLVERKQLSFDSTLGSLLPEYPSAEARDRVTVRHLLTMSSGIPDLFRVPEFWAQVATIKSSVALWKYFATSPLQFRPGTQWSYSNSNFLLLGAIIERQTGRAFPSVVEAEIFRPLGLVNTRYEVGGSPKPALGYTRTPPAGARADSARWYPAWEEPKPGDDCISAPRWVVATRPQTTWPRARSQALNAGSAPSAGRRGSLARLTVAASCSSALASSKTARPRNPTPSSPARGRANSAVSAARVPPRSVHAADYPFALNYELD